MEDDHDEDDECGFHDLVGGLTNDCCQHVGDAKDRDPRKSRKDLFNVATGKHTDDDACDDGDQNDLNDCERHALCINGHVLTGQPLGEKGGHEGCQKSGNRCHGHRECNVTLSQVRDDIRGGATRGATDQDDAGCNCRIEVEQLGQKEGDSRHDHVLRDNTDDDGQGALHDKGKVGKGQGQAHAEHDDAQADVHTRGELCCMGRENQTQSECRNNDERKYGNRNAGRTIFLRKLGLGGNRGWDGFFACIVC